MNDICSVRSTLDEQGKAAVLLVWGPIQAVLTPDIVLTTAQDLMAAAISAETDIALIETLREDVRLEDYALGRMLTAIRVRRPVPEGKSALRIAAIAGAKTGKPYVQISRGSMSGQLDPDEARTMAVHWVETATAAHMDVRLRYALGEWDHQNVEDLFKLIQAAQR